LNIPAPRQKHNYTSEIELKSLLIRVQNWNETKAVNIHRLTQEEYRLNRIINRYIKVFTKLNNQKESEQKQKASLLKKKLKERIINLSVQVQIDPLSYENFGSILLLMIKNILKKHQFSGYSYRDDFYSDAIGKILKYLHNFDHSMISERSGQEVSAFAYISQIIHNSIVFIIKQKAKEQENLKDVISLEVIYGEFDLKSVHKKSDAIQQPQIEEVNEYKIKIEDLSTKSLYDILSEINKEIDEDKHLKDTRFCIEYPSEYRISFTEYDSLKPLLKGNFSIVRASK